MIKFSSKTKTDKFEKTSLLPIKDGVLQMPEKMSITIGIGASANLDLVSPIDKVREVLPNFVVNYLKKYYKYNLDENAKTDTLGFTVALGLEVGGKLEASAPWKNIWHDTSLLESQPIYKDLSKGEITGSVYFKAEAKAQLGAWSLGKPAYEPSETLFKRIIVPSIPSISVKTAEAEDEWAAQALGIETDTRPYRKLFYAPISGNLIDIAQVGYAVYDEDKQLVVKKCDLPWLNDEEKDGNFFKNGTYREILEVDPYKGVKAKYTAYPVVVPFSSFGGAEMLADAKCVFEMDTAYINIEKREITVDKEQHYSIEDRVVPNMKNLQVKAEADWIEDILWLDHKNELSFGVKKLPEKETYRRGVIRLTGLSQKGEELIIDSIVVKQGEEPKPGNYAGKKFIGTWFYGTKGSSYYVEYTFNADGTYRELWDTSSTKRDNKGFFVVNSYSEEESGDEVMRASLTIYLTDENGKVIKEQTINEDEFRLIKKKGYVNGDLVDDAYRVLVIGWNQYKRAE